MDPWQSSRLPGVIDALARPEDDSAVRALAAALGDAPDATERLVGEPPRRSRRLRFPAGGELFLHDGVVVGVALRFAPAPGLPRALDPRAWLGTATDAGTLDEVTAALGGRARFAGWGTPYVAVDGAHVRCDYRDRRGWKEPGNLLGVTVTVDAPGRASRPEDDDCPTCADLLVRGGSETSEGSGMDVDATVAAVAAALAAGLLTEDVHRVRLADLRPLHASGLMDHVESQLTCTTCRRILCLALRRDGAPTLGHHVLDEARRHPLEPVPPVEQWGDAARIAAAEAAMRYVDHQPGAWFLVEQQGALFLQARYVISSMADDSALVRLDATEVAAYRVGGHDYLSALARRIHDGSPHRPGTPFHDRDLLRGPDGPRLRDEVGAAIANHTWIAEQHRRS